jgi:hypothetical protein
MVRPDRPRRVGDEREVGVLPVWSMHDETGDSLEVSEVFGQHGIAVSQGSCSNQQIAESNWLAGGGELGRNPCLNPCHLQVERQDRQSCQHLLDERFARPSALYGRRAMNAD